MTRILIAMTLGLGLLPSPSFAQDLGSQSIEAVLACQSQTDPQARLACQDSAIQALAQAYQGGQIAIVERAQVAEAQRDGFGLNLTGLSRLTNSIFAQRSDLEVVAQSTSAESTTPQNAPPGTQVDTDGVRVDRDDDGEIRSLIGLVVDHVRTDARGKLEIHLSNGQVWQQMDNTRVRVIGDYESAEIQRRALGSYYMKLNDQSRFFRVEREH